MPSQPHIIEDDLKIGWGSRVLMEHVSFEIDRGTTCAILGGSGSGKSTLLRYLIGLERPMAGRIDVDGIGSPHLCISTKASRDLACSSNRARCSAP
jgi:phospholipid/cholesterol/gamma-HCH transport system ATP-binding protein